MSDSQRSYAVMLKPVGSSCNLSCSYCYYLGKNELRQVPKRLMSDQILESTTRQIIAMHGAEATIEFAWHGGEPLLAGRNFYRRALAWQQKYGAGRQISNSLQTNGLAVTDKWAAFLAENRFLVGLSLDGPQELHDVYRRSEAGGSFAAAVKAARLFGRHGVSFNVLCTVNAANQDYGREVYLFLRQLSAYLQFLPVVECRAAAYETEAGQNFALPPGKYSVPIRHPVTDFSVAPEGYGRFLCSVLAEWQKRDCGRIQVQQINTALAALQNLPAGLCTQAAVCGHAAVVEADGEVYRCDRYVFGSYRLGNLLTTPLKELMEQNRAFGIHKTYGLPEECLRCAHIRLCFGGCPKDRFLLGTDGRLSKNYLCAGYKMFFSQIKLFKM